MLGITVNVDPKDFSVGIEDFNKMDFDMRLGGSGGDYDPDDGLVDWMQTSSKFNGRTATRQNTRSASAARPRPTQSSTSSR